MIDMTILETRISLDCIRAHSGSATKTVDDALEALRLDVERSVTALANRQFPKGTTIHIKAFVRRPTA